MRSAAAAAEGRRGVSLRVQWELHRAPARPLVSLVSPPFFSLTGGSGALRPLAALVTGAAAHCRYERHETGDGVGSKGDASPLRTRSSRMYLRHPLVSLSVVCPGCRSSWRVSAAGRS